MKNQLAKSAVAIAAALFLFLNARPASAVDPRHMRQQKDLPPELQRSLEDMLSDVVAPYFEAEEKKHGEHKVFTDLQQKFEYLPNWGPHGQLVVSAKMGGAEYDPTKPGSSKGAATGMLRYLVFTYSLQKGKWVEAAKPKWEHEDLGVAAGKQMTGNIARGDQRKTVIQQTMQKRAASAAAAAAAAQHAADRAGH
jgi:hypothetical protein